MEASTNLLSISDEFQLIDFEIINKSNDNYAMNVSSEDFMFDDLNPGKQFISDIIY